MRQLILNCARATALAGPVVLAFFSGGYFDGPRAWAGLVAWVLVAIAAVTTRRPICTSRPAVVALGGLALLAAWTLVSFTWSPIAGTAYHDGQRVILYLGALLATAALFRGRAARIVEPAVAAGTLVIVGYGISERLLPWLLTFQHSVSAEGRLEQPLTYWNAMGAVAAIGLVLCAHLAGEETRPARLRLAAAAGAAPLGLGLYCTFSRGALFACVVGLVALVVLARTRSGLRGILVCAGAAVVASLLAAPFHGVTSLAGSHHTRVIEGTVTLVLLLAVVLVAVFVERRLIAGERAGTVRSGTLPLPRHAGTYAVVAVVAAFALFLIVGAKEGSTSPLASGATRLVSLQSNRYSYWNVAWRAFRTEPVHGVGGGGWAVYWLRYRPFDAGAQDAHSLYIQTAAELGVVGLIWLGAFIGGVAVAARRALRVAPGLAAGPIAGTIVWAAHAAVDWDWEMPAVTLLALLLAGVLLALGELAPAHRPASSTAPR